MKKLIILFFALTTIAGVCQQNTHLSANLLLAVQSGANSLPGTDILGGKGSMDDAAYWTYSADWTITGGVAVKSSGNSLSLRRNTILESGSTYSFSATVVALSGTAIRFSAGLGSSYMDFTNTGSVQCTLKADGTDFGFYIIGNGSTGTIDNIVIRKIHTTALTLPDPSYSMTNTGAIPTYGHKGNSSYLAFDGVDDYMTLPATTTPFSTNDFSVLIRVKPTAVSNSWLTVGAANSFGILLNPSGTITVYKAGVTDLAQSATAIVAGTWYTIIYTRSGTTGTYYFNGEADGSITDAQDYTAGIDYIGGTPGYALFNGSISSYAIFNYALSASDVAYYSNPANHLKAVDSDGSGDQNLLDITAESFISPTLIRDWYHSTDIALSGATAPRLVKSNLTAWRFNGTSSLLSTTNGIDNLTGDITISCWVNIRDIGVNYGTIFSTDKIRVLRYFGGVLIHSDNSTEYDVGTAIFSNDNWIYLCITRTSAGIATVYSSLSGALVKYGSGSSGTPVASSATYKIGVDNSPLYFNGVIENFKIYKKILSAEDIALDYASYQE